MEKILKNRTFWLSLALFFTGMAFGYLEHTFYQYIDENDVLVESWFMPLSFLCIFVGGIGMLFVAVQAIWLAIKKDA